MDHDVSSAVSSPPEAAAPPQEVAAESASPARYRRARAIPRRIVFTFLVLGTVSIAAVRMHDLLTANGFTDLEHILFGLFVVLMFPIAISFWIAFAGFFVRLRGGDRLALTNRLVEDDTPLAVRTAIVVPVHNEDPQRVSAGIRATYDSLERTGRLASFDFFILSDTTNPDIWVEEELVYDELRRGLSDPSRLRYRKRARNTEQKAGNIWDFCTRHGDDYRYMIVFDADSVMRGSTLVSLVQLMEQNEDVGIVQAPPVPANKNTFFGRLEQFAARAYGPLFQSGLNYVQCGEGNYYGHNAIIRLRPFVEHCRLPRLEGRGPLTGHIMSHDFVEAAFMRRAGYRVYLADELSGSYEEPPPTLIDYAARDRRWCQGNLQHARLLLLPGLNLVSRIHLAMGIMAYVSSPLWLLLLLISTGEAVRQQIEGHHYFPAEGSLFPIWAVSTKFETGMLFFSVMGLLFIPKLLATLSILLRGSLRRRFGGASNVFESTIVESFFSMLLAPILAVLQTQFVVYALLGRKVNWTAQERDDVGTPLFEAVRRHWGTTVLGLSWALLVGRFVPDLFPWLIPVVGGMSLAIPLSWFTSRLDYGRRAREFGLFLTPEETDPLYVLRRLREEIALRRGKSPAQPSDGLERVRTDRTVREIHLRNLPPEAQDPTPLEQHQRDGLVLRYRLHGPGALSALERHEVLLSRRAIETLTLS